MDGGPRKGHQLSRLLMHEQREGELGAGGGGGTTSPRWPLSGMGEVWCTRCHHNADPEVVSTEINGHMGGWMRKNCQAVNLL